MSSVHWIENQTRCKFDQRCRLPLQGKEPSSDLAQGAARKLALPWAEILCAFSAMFRPTIDCRQILVGQISCRCSKGNPKGQQDPDVLVLPPIPLA